MDLYTGKLFIHEHEGLSICAGVNAGGYAAYRIRPDKKPIWYWNNKNWPNESPYKKGEWHPFPMTADKTYIGCYCYYVDEGFLTIGEVLEEHGDIIGLSNPSDYLAYVPRKACRRIEWLENRKASLRVVA